VISRTPRLSDYCVLGKDAHLAHAPAIARLLLRLQGEQYLTGLGGLFWRLFGITRHNKNPNICNM